MRKILAFIAYPYSERILVMRKFTTLLAYLIAFGTIAAVSCEVFRPGTLDWLVQYIRVCH